MPRTATLALLLATALLSAPAGASAADVPGDRLVLSGRLDVLAGDVAESAIIVDGPVRIGGRVRGDVIALSGPVRVDGRVDGSVVAISGRITLGPRAVVRGDLRYGDERPVLRPGARVAGTVTEEGWSRVPWALVGHVAWWVMVTGSMLVLGLVVTVAVPRAVAAAQDAWRAGPGNAALTGLATVVVLPVAGAIAAVTVIALPLGLALLMCIVPLAAVGYVTGCSLLGRRLVDPATPAPLVFLAGFGVLRAVALIPAFGMLGWILASGAGAGALVVAATRRTPEAGAPPPAPPPAATATAAQA